MKIHIFCRTLYFWRYLRIRMFQLPISERVVVALLDIILTLRVDSAYGYRRGVQHIVCYHGSVDKYE